MPQPRSGRLVLVIEDHADTRELYVEILRDEGILVVGAGSALTAMEMTRSARFDAIVVDRMLPDMDGLDLCAKLREQEGGQRTALVVLSGRRPESADLPCDAYLEKPVLPEHLVAVLQKLFATRP